jgi:hypothetical protein
MLLLAFEILILAVIVGVETRSLGYGLLTAFGGSIVLGAVTVALPRVATLLGVALGLAWGVVAFTFGYLDDGNLPLAFGLGLGGLVLGLGGNSFLFSGLSRRDDVDRAERERLRPAEEQAVGLPRAAAELGWPAEPTKVWDAREVLGVRPRATRREVERAFRARMKEYDPSQVANLGPELRELAARKAEEIRAARNALVRFGR